MNMKHFVVFVKYKVPMSEIEKHLKEHREYLQIGYDKGLLLCSGPQNPKVGGVVIARGEEQSELINFFSNDPYNLNNLVSYEYIEFNPVKHQPFLKDWID
jgi:uncharacterized protein YciI